MSSRARWLPDLLRPGLAHLRVPAAHELLDARHVDRAVVQVLLDRRQVGGEEAAVGADRVAAQRHRPRLGDVLADEGERARRRPPPASSSTRGSPRAARSGCASRRRTGPSGRARRRPGGRRGRGPRRRSSSSSSVTIVAISTMTSVRVVEARHLEIHPHEHDRGHYRWHDDRACAASGGQRVRAGVGRAGRRRAARAAQPVRVHGLPRRRPRTPDRPPRRAPRPTRPARRSTWSPIPSPIRRTSRPPRCSRTHSPALQAFLDHVQVVVTVHGYGRDGMFTTLLLGGSQPHPRRHLARRARRRRCPTTRSSTTSTPSPASCAACTPTTR